MAIQKSHRWGGEVDVSYVLEISSDRFKEIITTPASPFNILTEILEDSLVLTHKRYNMQQPMVSGPLDPAETEASIVFQRVTRALQFDPTYGVHQEWDYESPESIKVYRDLSELLEIHSVPYFIVVEDEGPITSFSAGGHNPKRGLRINNERPDIFPL